MFNQGVFDSPNVQQMKLPGIIGGLSLHGVEDQPVLARGRREVLRQARVDVLILVRGVPQALDDALDALQSRSLEQRVVKEPVEVVVASNVVGAGTRFALSQILAKGAQRLVADVLDRMKNCQGLEGLPHHEDLQQLGRIQRPHTSTHVGLDDDETLTGELSKSLSDGDSAGAAPTRDNLLNDPLSRRELTVEDLLS